MRGFGRKKIDVRRGVNFILIEFFLERRFVIIVFCR